MNPLPAGLLQNRNMLTWAGFTARRLGCLDYFTFNTRDSKDASGQQQPPVGPDGVPLAPVVLLHGVGCGLLPYFKLLVTLASTGEGQDPSIHR